MRYIVCSFYQDIELGPEAVDGQIEILAWTCPVEDELHLIHYFSFDIMEEDKNFQFRCLQC